MIMTVSRYNSSFNRIDSNTKQTIELSNVAALFADFEQGTNRLDDMKRKWASFDVVIFNAHEHLKEIFQYLKNLEIKIWRFKLKCISPNFF